MVYKVGKLYGIVPLPRVMLHPPQHLRPPEEWLAHRCKRCSQDANPDGRPSGGFLSFSEGPSSLSEEVRDQVAADFKLAASTWPPEAAIEVDEDGWVWLHHTPEAHERVMAWVRARICRHRRGR